MGETCGITSKKYNPVILSAPSSEPDSSVGKKRWVERDRKFC